MSKKTPLDWVMICTVPLWLPVFLIGIVAGLLCYFLRAGFNLAEDVLP